MEEKPLFVKVDTVIFSEGAEAWISTYGSSDTSIMDDAELGIFIENLKRIATIHTHLLETVLDKLFDTTTIGSASSKSLEEAYFICLGQFVVNPVHIAPELILKGLDCLDEARNGQFQRVIKHAEAKLAKEYPYLYSLHLRKQRARQVNGRPALFGDMGREAMMVKKVHVLEKTKGVQLMEGSSLLTEKCRTRNDLPSEMVEFTVKKEMQGDLKTAVDMLDVLFNTLKRRSIDEQIDFLTHMRRVFTNSSLAEMEDKLEMIQHWEALHDIELQMSLLTHNWSVEHPLTKRLKRIIRMQDQQDRAGHLRSLVWGYNARAHELVN